MYNACTHWTWSWSSSASDISSTSRCGTPRPCTRPRPAPCTVLWWSPTNRSRNRSTVSPGTQLRTRRWSGTRSPAFRSPRTWRRYTCVFIERDNDNVPSAIDRVRIAFTVARPSRHAVIHLRKKRDLTRVLFVNSLREDGCEWDVLADGNDFLNVSEDESDAALQHNIGNAYGIHAIRIYSQGKRSRAFLFVSAHRTTVFRPESYTRIQFFGTNNKLNSDKRFRKSSPAL